MLSGWVQAGGVPAGWKSGRVLFGRVLGGWVQDGTVLGGMVLGAVWVEGAGWFGPGSKGAGWVGPGSNGAGGVVLGLWYWELSFGWIGGRRTIRGVLILGAGFMGAWLMGVVIVG